MSRPGALRLRALPLWLALLPACLMVTGCFSSPPQIVALAPAAGSTQLGADAEVEVVFDQPVRRASVAANFGVCALVHGRCVAGLPDCPDLAAAFTASPGAPCWITWLSGEPGFIFHHPGALFAPDTKYQFDLSGGVTSAEGTVNSLDHTWDLTSAPAPVLDGSTPGNGATGVARDAPLTLSFSRVMSLSAVQAALTLHPAAGGLRVYPEGPDPSSFEVVPARPLSAGTAYTLGISRTASDAHGQPLPEPVSVRFTTGGLSGAEHSVVLAGPLGGPASLVLIGGLSAPSSGEPIPDEGLLSAPLCPAAAGCGDVPRGQATEAILEAALSPGAGWLAVVEAPLVAPDRPPVLSIVNLATGQVQLSLAGAEWPAWSPDGRSLALVAGGSQAELYVPATGSLSSVASAASITGPPVWTGAGDALALAVQPSATAAGVVDVVVPALQAGYTLPGISGQVLRMVAAPSGEELAVETVPSPAGGSPSTWVADPASGSPPQRLAGGVVPVGFTDSDTLIVAITSPSGAVQLSRITLGTGGTAPLSAAPGQADLAETAVAPSGRQIAYLDTLRSGGIEAMIANADGTGAVALAPPPGGLTPLAISISG